MILGLICAILGAAYLCFWCRMASEGIFYCFIFLLSLLNRNGGLYILSTCVLLVQVYPNGSGASQGTHLSVFLEVNTITIISRVPHQHCIWSLSWSLNEKKRGVDLWPDGNHVMHQMVEGGNEAAKYEYGIELLHRSRPNQRIVRKFSSDFEASYACTMFCCNKSLSIFEELTEFCTCRREHVGDTTSLPNWSSRKGSYLQPEEDTITLRFYVRPLT